MNILALTTTTAFASSLALTAAVRAAARWWGILDHPDSRRKQHGRAVPLWGGAAVYGAAALGLAIAWFGPNASHEFTALYAAWLLTGGFVCLVGAIDDWFDLPARLKLLLQTFAVLPIVLLGYTVESVVAFGYPIHLGLLGAPLTILWLLGCINALNLIDGMDGLASVVGLSAAAMLGMIAVSEGHPHVAMMAFALAAALVGFLYYNLPPASIFLGDSGSMVIGLSLGLLGIQGSLKTSATLAITAPAVVMTLPMFDVLAAILRRRLTGRRFDAPDRQHIHHRLLDRGWTNWQVLCLLGALCLTMGGAATAATIFRRDALAWIAAVTLVVLLIRLRLFGHHEYDLLKRALCGMVRAPAAWPSAPQPLPMDAIADNPLAPRTDENRCGQPIAPTSECDRHGVLLWDFFLLQLRRWKVREVEFRRADALPPRGIRWIDPAGDEPRCRWSLSVSVSDDNGAVYELRAAGEEPLVREIDRAALTATLKAFSGHFAAHAGLILGPASAEERPAAAVAEQRQAA
jgi:UDP-GlcNAc:undecaprenyl-phosphate GlcNAc-1-phosphate transferase